MYNKKPGNEYVKVPTAVLTLSQHTGLLLAFSIEVNFLFFLVKCIYQKLLSVPLNVRKCNSTELSMLLEKNLDGTNYLVSLI